VAYAWDPMGVLGGWVFPYERGTPVSRMATFDSLALSERPSLNAIPQNPR